MKVLVTGATGFIGSMVVRKLLERGREVRAYMQPGQSKENLTGLDVEFVEGDLLDPVQPKKVFENVDTVYHLAAIYALWLPQRARMYRVNVEGTVSFLRQAMQKAALKKVVFTSSIAAAGTRPGKESADESTLFNAWDTANDYIYSKYISELEVQRMVLQEGLPATIVNPAFPFGPGDIAPTPTGKLMLDVVNGKTPGYLDSGWNVVDVEDVAMAHVLAEEKGRLGERHLACGHNISHRDFGRLVARIAGVSIPERRLDPRLLSRIGSVMEFVADHITHKPPMTTRRTVLYGSQHLYFDNTKVRTVLGMPVTPIEETIRKSLIWFRDHGRITRPITLQAG